MKILIVGDIHLKRSNINERMKLLSWVEELSESVDLVVYLGDIFHDHQIIYSNVHNLFCDHLNRLKVETIIIEGNHDIWKPKDSTHSSLRSLNAPSNVTIVSTPTDIHGFSFIPFLPDMKDFPSKGLNEVVFTHNEFKGATTLFYKFKDGIDPNEVNCQLVISGHIHLKQTLGKVFYVGTPIADGVNDADQEKGVHIYDSETKEFEFIESPFPRIYVHSMSPQEAEKFVIPADNHKHILEIVGERREVMKASKSLNGVSIRTKIVNKQESFEGFKPKDVLIDYVDKKYPSSSLDILKLIESYMNL